jgi:hypothetical protein
MGYASPVRRLALFLVVGLVPGLLSAAQSWALGGTPTLGEALVLSLPPWFFWALAAPAVVALGRRFPLERGRILRSLPVHLVAGVVAVLAHAAFAYTVWLWIKPFLPGQPVVGAVLLLGKKLGFPDLLIYAVIVAGAHALSWRVAAAELEGRLLRARLDALRTQLQPHFLFNTLNAVSVLVRKGEGPAAVQAIADLGDLLRVALDAAGTEEIELGDELAFVERYLDLERLRFGDRLAVRVDVPAELRVAGVPSLVLQPLVENALKHGLARRAEPGRVEIVARRRGEALELEVRDDGAGPAAGWERGGGVGLANLRARLAQLFPGRHLLALEPAPAGGAVARVALPWRRA